MVAPQRQRNRWLSPRKYQLSRCRVSLPEGGGCRAGRHGDVRYCEQELSIVIEPGQDLREGTNVTLGIKLAAGLALLAVLYVFVAPTFDLPDSIKLGYFAGVILMQFVFVSIPPQGPPAALAEATSHLSDQVCRVHFLRI